MSITWDDFEKIDIRVGTIMEVTDFPKAKKPAYQITVDFGELGIKKTSAQITTLYDRESLIGEAGGGHREFSAQADRQFFQRVPDHGSLH